MVERATAVRNSSNSCWLHCNSPDTLVKELYSNISVMQQGLLEEATSTGSAAQGHALQG